MTEDPKWELAILATVQGFYEKLLQDPVQGEVPVPAGLDWDLWLGPAPARPFNNIYVPGPKWYRWWDFGSGTMSDLGSHWVDLPSGGHFASWEEPHAVADSIRAFFRPLR